MGTDQVGREQPTDARASRHEPRLRLLVLGSGYSSLSIACLEAVARVGEVVLVGVDRPKVDPLRVRLRRWARAHGLVFVARRVAWQLYSQARLGLRRLGVPLPGAMTLWEMARALRAPAVPCPDPNAPAFVEEVRRLRVDLIVVVAHGRILKPPLIETPRLGCINVHPALLPRYRGPNPLYWVLANGEATTGVTVHHIDAGIDTGDIILQRPVAVRAGDTEMTLQDRASGVAAALVAEAVRLLGEGHAPRTPQDESQASYYGRPPLGASRF